MLIETNTKMKYSFTFYSPLWETGLMLYSNSLETIAVSLQEHCEAVGSDLMQIQVKDTPKLRDLFNTELVNRKFALIEFFATPEGGETEICLVYKRDGFTLGPTAENNWGQDG